MIATFEDSDRPGNERINAKPNRGAHRVTPRRERVGELAANYGRK
jgi:hypothetical protein